MNKKHLSVVMAGAMLASSVAPVLAANATEEQKLAYGQRGLLIDALRTKMESKKFEAGNEKGKSVYAYTITNDGKDSAIALKNEIDTMPADIKGASVNQIIKIYEKEYQTNKYGQITSKAETASEGTDKVIKNATELSNLENTINGKIGTNKFIKEVKWEDDSKKEKLIVVLNAVEDLNAAELKYKTVELSVGSVLPDFDKPLDKDGKPLDSAKESDVQKFEKFEVTKENGTVSGAELTGKTLLATVKLVKDNDGSVANNFLVSDLFDGLMLTEEGTKLFELIKDDKVNDGIDYQVTLVDESIAGIASFEVKYIDKDNNDKVIKTITVRGSNIKDAKILRSYLFNKKFTVGKLAGEDRYETAAKIAKEQAGLKTVANNGHIVLVNGSALVDGLSAAPLASALGNSGTAAPILLTSKDSLPAATKSYLKELLATIQVGQLKDIQIDLVGGEAVLSDSLVKELKDLGFEKVKRYGGENREETSLEVARKIASTKGIENFYVVGAKGEADAMSIAPVASTVRNKGAIIVSDFAGLSKNALRTLEDTDANVTIVGGNAGVSEADEVKVKAIVKEHTSRKTTKRVAGEDRKATNAAIIKEYYNLTTTDAVIVAKDNVLVDALTAANLASQKNAPIVLATNSLSNEQINEINLKAGKAKALYQVGEGVNPTTVMKKLADLLGLPVQAK